MMVKFFNVASKTNLLRYVMSSARHKNLVLMARNVGDSHLQNQSVCQGLCHDPMLDFFAEVSGFCP